MQARPSPGAWANKAEPADQLDATKMKPATRIAGKPRSRLAMHKLVVNQVSAAAVAESGAAELE